MYYSLRVVLTIQLSMYLSISQHCVSTVYVDKYIHFCGSGENQSIVVHVLLIKYLHGTADVVCILVVTVRYLLGSHLHAWRLWGCRLQNPYIVVKYIRSEVLILLTVCYIMYIQNIFLFQLHSTRSTRRVTMKTSLLRPTTSPSIQSPYPPLQSQLLILSIITTATTTHTSITSQT